MTVRLTLPGQRARGIGEGEMTTSIGTIRDLIDHDCSLTAWCRNCQHSHVFDLQKLGERLGFDHSTMRDDLTPELR